VVGPARQQIIEGLIHKICT